MSRPSSPVDLCDFPYLDLPPTTYKKQDITSPSIELDFPQGDQVVHLKCTIRVIGLLGDEEIFPKLLRLDQSEANGIMADTGANSCMVDSEMHLVNCRDICRRQWLRQVLGEDVARSGVGEEIRHFLVAFYADDGLIQARCPERLQSAFDILIELFERVGLVTNTRKTKAMVCIPGRIRTRLTDDVYNNSRVGLMSREEWNRRRVECDICQQEVSAESLTSHLETQHNIFRSFVLNRDLVVEREPMVHNTTYLYYSKRYHCPVPGCTGGESTKWNLHRHFSDCHPNDLFNVPGEGLYRKCERCGMQVSPSANKHKRSAHCWDGRAKRLQHEADEHSAQALDTVFTAYGKELERVEVFKYLGRLLAYNDNDAQALRVNLKKA